MGNNGAVRGVAHLSFIIFVAALLCLSFIGKAAAEDRSGINSDTGLSEMNGNGSHADNALPASTEINLPDWSVADEDVSLTPPPMIEEKHEATVGEDGGELPIPANEKETSPSLNLAISEGSSATSTPASGENEIVEEQEQSAFSNGCRPPKSWKTVYVPKSLKSLRKQVGAGYYLARRGQFLIASNLDNGDFSAMVDGVLACCRECLSKDYFDTTPKEIITIYVFRDEKSYNGELKRIFDMNPISPYGHYGHSKRYIVVNYDTGPGTLVHELTHSLMAPDFPEAPIWISEGIASLYEQCKVENESLKGEQNWRLPELKKALESNNAAALKNLFSFSPRDFRAKRESLHYAQSRYFCMYLESLGKLREVYRDFRDNCAQDPSGISFIEKACEKKLPEIEAEWHNWLAKQSWK
ncbi:MAG: hypothetical protein JXR97_10295 [Planctomycetes bacterium]|nr:hypothetical protein [Planctomycetota bacterium]